jgi:hypothetical protein
LFEDHRELWLFAVEDRAKRQRHEVISAVAKPSLRSLGWMQMEVGLDAKEGAERASAYALLVPRALHSYKLNSARHL